MKNTIIVFVLSFVWVSFQQGSSEDIKQQVRRKQYATRDENKMNYGNVQSYTIKSIGLDSFLVIPQVDQQVKCQIYAYWKEGNIFASSEYREGEQIRILVVENDMRIVVDQSFYSVIGFSFNTVKGGTYQIRFYSKGQKTKLISLTISKMLDSASTLINYDDVLQKNQRIRDIRSQIQTFFSVSQRNHMIQKQLTQQVLKTTNIYMGVQVFEMVLVIVLTIFQIIFVNNILTTNSII